MNLLEYVNTVPAVGSSMLFCLRLLLVVHPQQVLGIPQDTTIQCVTPTDRASENRHYHGNRSPLVSSPMICLPPGSIKADGWLDHQLELMADGQVGHFEEISRFLTSNSGWLGGTDFKNRGLHAVFAADLHRCCRHNTAIDRPRWSLWPASPWNSGLAIDPRHPGRNITVEPAGAVADSLGMNRTHQSSSGCPPGGSPTGVRTRRTTR